MHITLEMRNYYLTENLAATFEISDNFTEELAEEVNNFFIESNERFSQYGSHRKAALKLYADECFKLAIKNYDACILEEFITDEFRQGIEGFKDFESAGISLITINGLDFSKDDYEIVILDGDL